MSSYCCTQLSTRLLNPPSSLMKMIVSSWLLGVAWKGCLMSPNKQFWRGFGVKLRQVLTGPFATSRGQDIQPPVNRYFSHFPSKVGLPCYSLEIVRLWSRGYANLAYSTVFRWCILPPATNCSNCSFTSSNFLVSNIHISTSGRSR